MNSTIREVMCSLW